MVPVRLTDTEAVLEGVTSEVCVAETEPVAVWVPKAVPVARGDSDTSADIVAVLEGVGSAVAAAERVVVRVSVVEGVGIDDLVEVTDPLSVAVDEIVGFIVREGVLEPVVVREEVTV